MITYWPNRQSVDLNLAVSNLFAQAYQKLSFELSSKTNDYLAIDILSEQTKRQLLIELLTELEILIVDIIELNLSTKELKQLNDHILLHFLNTATRRLITKLQIQKTNFYIGFHLKYNQLFFQEHSCAFYILLAYLVFGSESILCYTFPFRNKKTPFYHVKALFENAIIQASNITAFNLIENSKSIQTIYSLIYNSKIAHSKYHSIRKISNFKNNLIGNSLINTYMHYPQSIYCGKYNICLLSSKGIIRKYIYLNRSYNYLELSNYQLGSVLYLEIQDFIIPRFNKLISLIGKLIIYVFSEIFSKNFSSSLRYIIKKISEKKY